MGPPLPTATELLKRYHNAICRLEQVMSGVLGLVQWQAPAVPLRQRYVYGYFTRVHGWVTSLARLDRPSDLQAATSAARTSIEIIVDMFYVHLDATDGTAQQIVDWEQSEKLKWAEATVAFYSQLAVPLPAHQSESQLFIATNKVQIEAYRLQNWGLNPKTKKPRIRERWSGNTVVTDIARLRNLRVCQQCLHASKLSLEVLYAGQWKRLCAGVHGSGLALQRNVGFDTIVGVTALSIRDVIRLGVCATQIAIHDWGLDKIYGQIDKDLESVMTGLGFDPTTWP
jgi:hypothetical protein